MPKFIIERDIPGAGGLSLSELQAITEQSCGILRSLGPRIQWVESYVTDDKVYCVYLAEDEALIRAHASRSGFAANRITRVRAIIDPTLQEVGLHPHQPAAPAAAAPRPPHRSSRRTGTSRSAARSKRRKR